MSLCCLIPHLLLHSSAAHWIPFLLPSSFSTIPLLLLPPPLLLFNPLPSSLTPAFPLCAMISFLSLPLLLKPLSVTCAPYPSPPYLPLPLIYGSVRFRSTAIKGSSGGRWEDEPQSYLLISLETETKVFSCGDELEEITDEACQFVWDAPTVAAAP